MVPDEFGHFLKYREVTGTPRGVYGPYWALVKKRRGKEKVGGAPPLAQYELGGGRPPLSFRLSSPSFSPTPTTWKGAILLPVGVGLPWGVPREASPSPSSTPLYMGEGAPHRHTS